MSVNNSSNGNLSDGIIITVFEDQGPSNIYNSSPLDEIEALNMAIKTLTVISSDVDLNYDDIRSYGPIPTPREPFVSLGFLFKVSAVSSYDSRIARHGRLVAIWIITRSRASVRYVTVYKQLIQRLLRLYQIKTDHDLQNEEILKKIDSKLRIIETGKETYYITETDEIEPFIDLALIPSNTPILLVDNPGREINVLIRNKSTPSKKINLMQVTNNFKTKIPKGSLYKVELVSDKLIIQRLLSKEGMMVPKDNGAHFRIHLTDKISFEELDEFLDSYLAPKRRRLVTELLKSQENKTSANIREISFKTGLGSKLIKDLILKIIETGFLRNLKMEEERIFFND